MTLQEFIEKYRCTDEEADKLATYYLALRLRGLEDYIVFLGISNRALKRK